MVIKQAELEYKLSNQITEFFQVVSSKLLYSSKTNILSEGCGLTIATYESLCFITAHHNFKFQFINYAQTLY